MKTPRYIGARHSDVTKCTSEVAMASLQENKGQSDVSKMSQSNLVMKTS